MSLIPRKLEPMTKAVRAIYNGPLPRRADIKSESGSLEYSASLRRWGVFNTGRMPRQCTTPLAGTAMGGPTPKDHIEKPTSRIFLKARPVRKTAWRLVGRPETKTKKQ
jgi:hypothetical protein